MLKEFRDLALFGSGTMGSGIAETFAQYDYTVYFYDKEHAALSQAMETIAGHLEKQINTGLIDTERRDKILGNIKSVTEIEGIPREIPLVIEAIWENKESKLLLLKQLNRYFNDAAVFASNTSSISITELGASGRPERFIGLHFMNPVPKMKLVEIINGNSTKPEITELVRQLVLDIQKVPVIVSDYPGFIANRILMPMINEAIFALFEGVASADDIDQVMKLGMNHPMGPLALADYIGLDVCLAIMEVLYDGFSDSKYRPCPLLKKLVAANKLGRKTKEGFFKY
jgi:3-hydroxybutyryl-CoA dehydrogenase